MKLIIGFLLFLLSATQAHATIILLDEFALDEQWFGGRGFHHADWIGTYTGPFSGISIPIGICAEDPEKCNFDSPIDTGFAPHIRNVGALGGYLAATSFFSTGVPYIGGRFDWFPENRLWMVHNEFFDVVPHRRGAYCVVGVDGAGCAVPEPSPIWLILAGAVLIAAPKFVKTLT